MDETVASGPGLRARGRFILQPGLERAGCVAAHLHFFGCFRVQVELDFAVEVRMQAPHGAQVQQQLTVGPEEVAGVEQALELFEGVVEPEAAVVAGH